MTRTVTLRALGFTDEITTCEHCGRTCLKGTVRVAYIDADGNEDGELYAGVTCAARLSGRTVKDLRAEAIAADKAASAAAYDLYDAWRRSRQQVEEAAVAEVLARLGLRQRLGNNRVIDLDPTYQETMTSWDAANPHPPYPW